MLRCLQTLIVTALLGGWLWQRAASAQPAPFAVVSAANYQADAAAEMIVAGFTAAIGNVSATAATLPLPTTLAGFSVQVRDSAGMTRNAGLFAVAQGQINFQIPPGTAEGQAAISLINSGNQVAAGTLRVVTVAPGLFTFNATRRGAPAGNLLKIAADGSQTYSSLALLDSKNRWLPQPFDAGEAGAQFYLVLFGTGLRNTRGAVTATIGTTAAPVAYAGAQGELAGLDQVNLGPLPETQTGNGGAFRFRNLAPGKYWILAQAVPKETEAPTALDTAARLRLRRAAEAANQMIELQPCQRLVKYELALK